MLPSQPLTNYPPGPRGYPLLGVLPQMWSEPLRFFQDAAATYGRVVRINFGSRNAFLLTDPAAIKYVLVDNNANYRKSSTVPIVAQVLGRGLATNEGESWLSQRRLMQPAFHRQQIARLGEPITTEAAALGEQWRAKVKAGEPVNMQTEMMRLTLRLVLKLLFGHDVQGEEDRLGQAWTVVLQEFNRRSWSLVQIPDSWPTPANRRFHRALTLLNETVYQLIDARRGRSQSHNDLLDLLLHAQDAETGHKMSDQQLRDEIMTLFLAGHETTANALSWTWYLLAQHPDTLTQLQAELQQVLQGRLPTVTDLPHLPYTRAVVDESLRLYPPFWLIYRAPYQPDKIGGYPLRTHDMVFISPYLMHRHPTYWPSPEQFQPERFSPEQAKSYSPYVYFPFGAGPHLCIGNNLALMETQLILATLAPQVHPTLLTDQPIQPEAGVTLRPRRGVGMRLGE